MMNTQAKRTSVTSWSGVKTVMVGAILAGLAGCSGQSVNASEASAAQDKIEPVTIVFKDGCPISVVPLTIDLNRNSNPRPKVQWTAKDEAGNTLSDQSYSIWYDPFVGQPIKSNGKGVATSPTVDKNAQSGFTYKYTVYADDSCPDAPLDPYFRVIE